MKSVDRVVVCNKNKVQKYTNCTNNTSCTNKTGGFANNVTGFFRSKEWIRGAPASRGSSTY